MGWDISWTHTACGYLCLGDNPCRQPWRKTGGKRYGPADPVIRQKPLTCGSMKTKKSLLAISFLSISILLVSWGVTGHRTVGKIAENHLTANAKKAIHELLGTETLADVSTWADEVRNQSEYKSTGPW